MIEVVLLFRSDLETYTYNNLPVRIFIIIIIISKTCFAVWKHVFVDPDVNRV